MIACPDCGQPDYPLTDDPAMRCGYCSGPPDYGECSDGYTPHRLIPMYGGIHPECEEMVAAYVAEREREGWL